MMAVVTLGAAGASPAQEAKEVRKAIDKVNTHW